ncbi:MAG: flagellar basal-body MS-ring/collar protein FliF [Parcubacteria group bacterium]
MSLVETFRNVPPRRQWLIVGAGVAVIATVLLVVYFTVLRKPYAVVFSDLRASDAATIVAELDKKKVPYRLQDGGATILVPRDMVDATRLDISSEDLPLKGMVGFELFNKSDMGLTEFAQKINYQRALQGELARTIMTMDEVDTARVHLAMTEPTIFREDRIPPKASVTIVPRPGKVLPPAAVRGIQRLVAAAVPDLDVGNVVILDQRGEILSNDAVAEPVVAPELQAKQAIEAYYAGRIRMALQQAYPANGVDVVVEAPSLIGGGEAENWAPGARQFSLRVTISTASAVTPQQQDTLTDQARNAIGFNPAIGDTVSMILAAPKDPAMPAIASPAPTDPLWLAPGHGSARRSLPLLNLALAAVLPLVLLLFLAAYLLNRRSRRGNLTPVQRSDYARRLKTLLEEEEADVEQAA